MISGKTKLAVFFASPSAHSLSPLMHNTAFQHCGIDAVYLAFEVDQINLKQAVESIRTLNMLGANVSMPNKTAVLTYLDELSPEAELIGAVNTIVHKNHRLIGYNTDGKGFVRSVKEVGHTIADQKITVLGAGGAAKAIVAQMALDGAKEIHIYKRKNATFLSLSAYFATVSEKTGCSISLYDYADEPQLAKDLKHSDLLINATDIGMGEKKGSLPCREDLLHPNLAVFDLIYSPEETQLLKEAKKIGANGYNGLGMLIHQGAIAFELWTQKAMPIEVIRQQIIQK
ncbi:shikimate dehydrogenase [Enterococcus villorum]|uniref:Shikimate dehydrogenase (NADP(+)) n=2 Tax=Enterococcus villorum TaxID=112904 RepID=A0A511IYB6_9ENTE|nr:shikimate dehydrogenase [Enterococcus villorum]EOH89814.1 shikimate 5-dehydrogenase [Enterococcus villorum ATCC 700913]EOW78046.1 shikimate 5-dehydrogenase [Enterococcus villorum ATCC 700913]GEL90761.1 shikimate dehydrogenase (NADP(+)) [Enterococcus villorum]